MKRTSGRREDLTLEEILDATLRLIQKDGLDKLSMRGVAKELGAATMATYNYVANKDELIALVHDTVIQRRGDLVLGDDGWEESLRRFLRTQWETYRRYPGLASWEMGRPDFGTTPEVFSMWQDFFAAAGFDERQATLAWSFCQTYAMGRLAVDARLRGTTDRYRRSGLRARDHVEYGIDAVIAGIRAMLASEPTGTAPAARRRTNR